MHKYVNCVVLYGCGRSNSMMDYPGKLFREKREFEGITQSQLAGRAGVSTATIQNVENPVWAANAGRSLLKFGTLLKVSKALQIDGSTARREWQIIRDAHVEAIKANGGAAPTSSNEDDGVGRPGPIFHHVPTFILECPASHWAELAGAEEDTAERDPRIVDQGLFRVYIRGRCMEPEWPDGALIEFEIWRQGDGREPPEGEDVALTNSDGMTTFKRLAMIDREKEEYVLRSINPAMPIEIRVPYQMSSRIAVATGVFTPKKRNNR